MKTDIKKNVFMRTVNSSFFVFLMVLLFLSPLYIGGCAKGVYVGMRLPQAAKKVLLFEIEGADGEEITKMLGTKLTGYGIGVVHGSQFDKPSDFVSAAKLGRDNQADSFIMGEITQSEIINSSKYTISGTFSIHDIETGDQIGGIANATITEDVDRLLFVGKTYLGLLNTISKEKNQEDKLLAEIEKQTKVKAVDIRQKFAAHVAKELSRGLGRKPAVAR